VRETTAANVQYAKTYLYARIVLFSSLVKNPDFTH